MRDAARTHNTTQSSRCVWPRPSRQLTSLTKVETAGAGNPPVHAAPTLHPHHRPRSHADYTCLTAAHPQLLRHLHRKYMHKCMQVPHQRSTSAPPTVGIGCVNHNRWSGRQRTHEPKRGRSFTHTGHGSTVQMKHMHGVPCACTNLGIGSFSGMLSPVSHPAALPHPPA